MDNMDIPNINDNFYEYSSSEEEVRSPDKVYRERLIDYRDDEELVMEKIMNESILLAEKNCEDNYNELINKMNERKQKYNDILIKFKKIVTYDKDIKEIYSLIEWIIEFYINMQIEFYIYDKDTYNKIFNIKLLKQIRLSDTEIDLLRNIILY